jgi:Fe-S cluster assembly protein SufB
MRTRFATSRPKKGEPQWLLDWRLKAFAKWKTMEAPDWSKLNVPPIDYQNSYYYAEPKAKPTLGSLDEVDPEILRVYEKLGIPIEEQKVLAASRARARSRSTRCSTASPSPPPSAPSSSAPASSSAPSPRRSGISGPRPQVARQGRADPRQLLRDAQQRGLLGRHLRLHPEGVRCPMELSTYFRINAPIPASSSGR